MIDIFINAYAVERLLNFQTAASTSVKKALSQILSYTAEVWKKSFNLSELCIKNYILIKSHVNATIS